MIQFFDRREMQAVALDFISVEHLNYLDDLQNNGLANMNHARPYLMREFPELTSQQAALVLSHWFQCNPDIYLKG